MGRYLDSSGLSHFLNKIKQLFGAEKTYVGTSLPETGESDVFYIITDSEGNRTTYTWNGTAFAEATNVSFDRMVANTAYINDLTAKSITTDDLQANTAYIGTLTSNSITTENLRATKAFIGELTAEQISAKNITADRIEANAAYIGTLEAKDITAENINANFIKVNELEASSINAKTIAAGTATIGSFQIDNDALRTEDLTITKDASGNITSISGTGTYLSPKGYVYASGSEAKLFFDPAANDGKGQLIIDATNVNVKEDLQLGKFKWDTDSNNDLSLVWAG